MAVAADLNDHVNAQRHSWARGQLLTTTRSCGQPAHLGHHQAKRGSTSYRIRHRERAALGIRQCPCSSMAIPQAPCLAVSLQGNKCQRSGSISGCFGQQRIWVLRRMVFCTQKTARLVCNSIWVTAWSKRTSWTSAASLSTFARRFPAQKKLFPSIARTKSKLKPSLREGR